MLEITRLEAQHLLECLRAAQDGSSFLMEEEIEQAVEILEMLLSR